MEQLEETWLARELIWTLFRVGWCMLCVVSSHRQPCPGPCYWCWHKEHHRPCWNHGHAQGTAGNWDVTIRTCHLPLLLCLHCVRTRAPGNSLELLRLSLWKTHMCIVDLWVHEASTKFPGDTTAMALWLTLFPASHTKCNLYGESCFSPVSQWQGHKMSVSNVESNKKYGRHGFSGLWSFQRLTTLRPPCRWFPCEHLY